MDRLLPKASQPPAGGQSWGVASAARWRKYAIPAPGEPGSETWKDKNNSWQTGGGAMWVTGSYDVENDQVLWGTGNPVPMFNPYSRPGINLYTNSLISWDPEQRQDELVLPVYARRHVGLR